MNQARAMSVEPPILWKCASFWAGYRDLNNVCAARRCAHHSLLQHVRGGCGQNFGFSAPLLCAVAVASLGSPVVNREQLYYSIIELLGLLPETSILGYIFHV